jgi:tetratricopeptide (TPR) repeat protein
MRGMKTLFPAAVLAALCAASAFPASAFLEKGEAAYAANRPQEARPLLEGALDEDPANERLYLYLGIVYQQLGDREKAIATFKRGLAVPGTMKDLLYYNIGNAFFSRGEYTAAEEMYTSALGVNTRLPEASLNRANARLAIKSYEGAIADYTLFLQMRPDDPQRPRIEEVIRLIRSSLDKAASKRAEELARQAALMNEVMNALNNAGDGAKNLSVESIEVKQDTLDVDIKD